MVGKVIAKIKWLPTLPRSTHCTYAFIIFCFFPNVRAIWGASVQVQKQWALIILVEMCSVGSEKVLHYPGRLEPTPIAKNITYYRHSQSYDKIFLSLVPMCDAFNAAYRLATHLNLWCKVAKVQYISLKLRHSRLVLAITTRNEGWRWHRRTSCKSWKESMNYV